MDGDTYMSRFALVLMPRGLGLNCLTTTMAAAAYQRRAAAASASRRCAFVYTKTDGT